MKSTAFPAGVSPLMSHPARGAWIEMKYVRPAFDRLASHPARGAWIEILQSPKGKPVFPVAPRKGCVD